MGLTISFENDKILKIMKTDYFLTIWKGSNFKGQEH